ncbi:MAG: VOC family protein [Chloroflexota bacterium]
MIPIRGLFETHLTVMHLERAVSFYRDVIGLELAYLLPERQVAFFWIGARGNAMLGLWCVGSAPLSMALHIAFDVALADLLTAPERLNAAGVTPRGFNGEPVAEPVVIGWMPAAALYFKDPDGHSLEYLAMLPQQSKAEIGVVTYTRWQAMHAPQG